MTGKPTFQRQSMRQRWNLSKSSFVAVPTALALAAKALSLNPTDVLVIAFLGNRLRPENGNRVVASTRKIAQALPISRQSADRCLKKLSEMGLIYMECSRGRLRKVDLSPVLRVVARQDNGSELRVATGPRVGHFTPKNCPTVEQPVSQGWATNCPTSGSEVTAKNSERRIKDKIADDKRAALAARKAMLRAQVEEIEREEQRA